MCNSRSPDFLTVGLSDLPDPQAPQDLRVLQVPQASSVELVRPVPLAPQVRRVRQVRRPTSRDPLVPPALSVLLDLLDLPAPLVLHPQSQGLPERRDLPDQRVQRPPSLDLLDLAVPVPPVLLVQPPRSPDLPEPRVPL